MMENYSVLCQIGKGACGAVYLARQQHSKKLYALKKIQLDESRKTRTKEAVLREARIMSELKHPQIVAFHESFFDENEEHLCIIQDYCDGGTLDDQIKEATQRKEYIPEKQIIQWFLQIAMAVRFMHSRRVLHRDLKTQNIFLDKSGTLCKLGDFGIAKNLDTTIEVSSTCVGTPCYLSPEMCQDIPYSSKADVWALGCLLYEILVLKPAFDANNLVSLFYKIVKGEYDPIPDHYSDDMHELIAIILCKSPEQRPSARGVLALPYVKEELLKFVEEKEFLLQQIRLPTRQGSRPYSTPTLRCSAGSQTDTEVILNSDQKRAISCRPLLAARVKERSLMASARAGQNGRDISTIPEETEEQILERSMRLEQLHHLNGVPSKSDSESISAPRSDSKMSAAVDSPRVERKVNREKHCHQDAQSSPSKTVASSQNVPSKSEGDTRNKSRSPEHKKYKNDHKRGNKEDKSGTLNPEKGYHDKKDKEKKNKLAKDAPTVPKLVLDGTRGSDSPRMQPKAAKGSNLPKLPKLALDLTEQEPPKKNRGHDPVRTPRIQEPVRTPRIQEPGPLVNQHDKHSQDKQHKVPKIHQQQQQQLPKQHKQPQQQQPSPQQQQQPSPQQQQQQPKPVIKVSKKKSNREVRRKSSQKSLGSEEESQPPRRRRSVNKQESGSQRPETRDSLLSVPFEPGLIDYYSDDFDESSGSEIEEDIPIPILLSPISSSLWYSYVADIPEEIADSRRQARSLSFTLTHDIPEIEEDLPYGLADDDDEMMAQYGDQEGLDDVVMVAREACDDLSVEGDDDVIIDDREKRPSTSKLIRKHCIDDLGKEKYERVKRYCENNEEPEMRKLEKMVGKEHVKTLYLMNEMSRKVIRK